MRLASDSRDGSEKPVAAMLRIAIRSAFVFVALFAQSAQAFFDPPSITPTNPIAGENVSVSVHGGLCDYIASRDGYPQLTRDGNAIRLLYYGSHYEPGSELCTDGVGTVTRSIGSYPPGAYTLTVDLIYPDPEFGAAILNIGVVAFTVRGAAPTVPVPASTARGLTALILLVIGAGLVAIRRGRPRNSPEVR